MREPRLFCLDSVLIDVVLRVPSFPPRAGDVRALEQLITTGGGFNAMSAAARHDVRCVYAGRLGTGPFAALATNTLFDEGIDAPVPASDSLDTGICVVLVEPDGERTFVTAAGAESTLRLEDLTRLGVREGDFVLVSGYNVMYPDLAAVVLTWLATLSPETVVLFDPASRVEDVPRANVAEVLKRATWLLCNTREATWITGEGDAGAAAIALARSRKSLGVVVRQGARGCVVSQGDTVVEVAGFATEVVDTSGAGDVHNGVFAAELATGHDALSAAKWANAAAAMAISRLGPATCPTRPEVAAFIAAHEGRGS